MKFALKNFAAGFLLFTIILGFVSGCGNEIGTKEKPSLAVLVGQTFYEVRRQFESGFCYNKYGFEQKPEWIMHFVKEDSVKIYSIYEKKFLPYSMYCDHDSVFNVAREWVRLKAISKDSIIFQLLQVDGRTISKDRSNVYMKFYSASYLKNVLHTTPEAMKRPLLRDTQFIRYLADIANRNPGVVDSAFGARKPAELVSHNKNLSVTRRIHTPGEGMERSKAYDYLYPEFDLFLKDAYKDFDYTFTVLIDDKGVMRLGQFLTSEEFKESRKRVLEGIIDVYLQKLLEVSPGTTLDIAHTSEVTLHMRGRK